MRGWPMARIGMLVNMLGATLSVLAALLTGRLLRHQTPVCRNNRHGCSPDSGAFCPGMAVDRPLHNPKGLWCGRPVFPQPGGLVCPDEYPDDGSGLIKKSCHGFYPSIQCFLLCHASGRHIRRSTGRPDKLPCSHVGCLRHRLSGHGGFHICGPT